MHGPGNRGAVAVLAAPAPAADNGPMAESFTNVYEDEDRARAYADLEYPGTYWLAFRDVPGLLTKYARGTVALDFGCGAGRSTRFLQDQGFEATGVDISASMLAHARERDPDGRYLQVPAGDLSCLSAGSFDLILSAFTFDNIPGREARTLLFRQLAALLRPQGCFVNLVSAPQIYVNEWLSFSTRDFPENAVAGSGDPVRIVMLDVPDRRPVDDVLWREEDYRSLAGHAGLAVAEIHRPLGRADEPFGWVTETSIAPWAIHVMRPEGHAAT